MFRNLVTWLPFLANFFIDRDLSDDIKLPDYRF